MPTAGRSAEQHPAGRRLVHEPGISLGPLPTLAVTSISSRLRSPHGREAPGELPALPPRHHRFARLEILAECLRLLVSPGGRSFHLEEPSGLRGSRLGRTVY